MVHVSLHWSEHGVNGLSLWGFAIKHAAWIHNCLPNQTSGLSPLELLAKTKANHKDLLHSYVWVCPDIVLYPKLQDRNKSRTGIDGLDWANLWVSQMSIHH